MALLLLSKKMLMYNLNKDYFFKILTNLVRVPVSFLLQSIFPRILGPIQYGNYEFLNDSFTRIITFLESGNTFAFYTKLSSDSSDFRLIKFYRILMLLTISLMLLITFVLCFFDFYIYLWPYQSISTILLIFFLIVFVYISNILLRILDSFLLTINIEKFRVLHTIFTLIIFIYFYLQVKTLNINSFILLQIILQLLLIFGSIFIINKKSKSILIIKEKLTKLNIKYYIQYFYKYSSPLFIFSIFALIFGFGDRWLLQQFSGSIEQAYFSISLKTGAFIFIFTNALIPLYIRENSKYFSNKNYLKMSEIYVKNIKLFMFLTVFLTTIVSFNSKFILQIMGGNLFKDANILFILMSFYPIHQTLGQINGALYYSTSRTKVYTNVGLFSLPLGFFISFILIAPIKFYGFNLGGIGLGIQMISIQFINQNILLYYNCKYLNISFFKLFLHQFILIALFIFFGFLIFTSLNFCHINNKLFFIITFSIFLFLISFLLLLTNPKLVGSKNIINIFKIKL